jgi:mRNA interferase MazF
VVRGDVFAIDLPKGRGHVQSGRRYAIVVQADDLMALSTVLVSPTSQSTPPASFHPEIEIEQQATRVMCEMTGAIDPTRLGKRVGHLSHTEMLAVDHALELVLDLGR